jgi:hypothetical protein
VQSESGQTLTLLAMSFVCVPVEWSGAARTARLESSVPLPWERLPASAACRGFHGFLTVFLGEFCGFSGSEELLCVQLKQWRPAWILL